MTKTQTVFKIKHRFFPKTFANVTKIKARFCNSIKMFQAQQPTSGQTTVNPIVINLPPVDPNHTRKQIQKSFPKRVMMLLSILQIVCGGLVFLMQV